MTTPHRAIHPALLDVEALLSQCNVRRTRRSGPGGQHRNKVETAVVLKHRPTGVVAEANERRSQSENLHAAAFRLRLELALQVRSKVSAPASAEAAPSALWLSRCRNRRISVSARHDDFPALLAEALDAVDAHGPDLRGAAEFLGCTRTQLVKFLKSDRRGLATVNRRRQEAGLKALQ